MHSVIHRLIVMISTLNHVPVGPNHLLFDASLLALNLQWYDLQKLEYLNEWTLQEKKVFDSLLNKQFDLPQSLDLPRYSYNVLMLLSKQRNSSR